MSSNKQNQNQISNQDIGDNYIEDQKIQFGNNKNNIHAEGLTQPLINQSRVDSSEQENLNQQSLPSYPNNQFELNVSKSPNIQNSIRTSSRQQHEGEKNHFHRRRTTKEGVVCFNKREAYLKNMKIYNALYNFTPPNQRLKTKSESISLFQQISQWIPVFEPSNKYLLIWEFTIFLMTCIVFFYIPIEVFYQVNLIPIHGFGMAIRIILSLFFMFDIMLTLNVGFFEKGKLIVKRRLIFKHYLGNFLNGKSLTDIIGLVGIILNTFQSDKTNMNISSYFCLAFYIRMLNLYEFNTVIIQQLQLHRKSKCAYQLLRLGIVIFFISNFFACIFYRVGTVEQARLGHSWLQTVTAKIGDANPSTLIYYLYSLYWSVTTMISVGYGDVTPVAPYEVLVTIICMMCSCILFAYSINSIWFIISEVSMGTQRYQLNMNAINRYMRDKSINQDLRKRIQAYLDFVWQDSKSREKDKENQIIQSLPQNLKLELIYEANSFFFSKFEWSKHFSYGFLQLLSQYIKEKKHLEDDLIYHQQEIEDDQCFYYVDEGEVQLYYDLQFYNNGFGIPIQTVKPGNFIGLYEFFSGEKRNESARCLELTNVYSISRKDFLEVVKNFPGDHQMYVNLKDQMVYQKNYKLFGLKCFLCDKDDHLSHQCVEVQLKKEIFKKNQQRQHPEIFLQNDCEDGQNNALDRRQSFKQLDPIALSKKKSQTLNFSNIEVQNENEEQKYYNLDLRLKYDVQYYKKGNYHKEQSSVHNQDTQRQNSNLKRNQIVQSSQLSPNNFKNQNVRKNKNGSKEFIKSNLTNQAEQTELPIQIQVDQEPNYNDQVEYVVDMDDLRQNEDKLRSSRRYSSLIDVKQKNYETAQKFIKSQAEIPYFSSKQSKSQDINPKNLKGEGVSDSKKSPFLLGKQKDEKVNINQALLDREQKRQIESIQKVKNLAEEQKKLAITRQNIAIYHKMNSQQQQLNTFPNNTQQQQNTSNQQLQVQRYSQSNLPSLSDQQSTSPLPFKRQSKQFQQDEEIIKQRPNTINQVLKDSLNLNERQQEIQGLLGQIVQKMMNEGNIISENPLEYTQSMISRKNENELDDIDVPPLENNADMNYVFYKYCKMNQY